MERGIITPAMEITSQGNSVSMTGGIPPEKLRYYLLYWDKIVLTDSNIFGTSLTDEFEILQNANVINKETARMGLNGTFNGSDLAKIHFQGLAEIASTLTTKNPGQWVIHQSGDQLVVPSNLSTELVTADFELSKCLPVPKKEIPIDKVLDFKVRHSDELQALREVLDELYLEISKSADIPRSKIAQITRLEKAIKDLDTVAQQSWGERLLASRKVSLDINYGNLGQGAVTAGIVGTSFSNPLLGLIVGAAHTVISGMKFEVSLSSQLSSPSGKQIDLSYLSSLKNEDIAK